MPASPVVMVGQSLQLNAAYNPKWSECPPSVPVSALLWQSADPNVATVDQVQGLLTGRRVGQTEISVHTRTFRLCWPLLAVAALAACGSPTRPTDSPDFAFTGIVTVAGPPPFHGFTTASAGDLTASVVWGNPQTNQTVCVVGSNVADERATCANVVAGRTNAVTVSVRAGDPYVVYAVPGRSADAAYTIEVRIR
jgi:hypothetical protein